MGRNHARVYSLLDNAVLTAVYDADAARAAAVAAEFGAQAVASLEALAEVCDLASVAVPTVAHRAVGCRLMELGLHVLMEKPIAPTLADAQVLVETSQRTARVLQIGHIERFNPVLRELEKKLSRPRFIEAHRLSPFPNRSVDIGVVLDLMIHDLEIILHLVRSPITSVDPVGISVLGRGEDIANVRFRFENGCVANLTASRISQDRVRKIRVFQENAYLSLDYKNQSGYLLRLARDDEKETSGIGKLIGLATDSKIVTDFSGHRIVREPVEVEKGEPLRIELESFVQCARQGLKPRVTGQAAAAALDIALEITRRIEAADPRK